jgi:ABC-type transport system substrate-binding protein
VLGTVALGAGSAAFLAACSGDDASEDSGAATSSSGTQGTGSQASTEIYLDAKTKKVTGKETIEELRERFHSRHFKQLPGHANGPKYGGTLRWNSNVPTSWDLVGPVASQLASYSMFHNSLVTFEIGDMSDNLNFVKMEGDLARAWEQPDRQTLTFKLNEGIKWQNVAPVNGRAFTSEDVKYAVEAYQKAPVQSTIYRDVDVVETPDANTAVFKMKQPVAYFLNVLMQPHNLIFSREQHQSPQGLASGPIGTGPFIFEGGQDRVGYKGRKNPDYFKKDPWTGKQLPYVDAIETQYYTDINASIAAFRDKQIDTYYPINHTLWMDVLKTNPEVITQFNTPAPSAQPFFPVRNDKPPFNDVRVRRALSMAIDREAIIAGPVSGMGGYGYGLDWTYFGQEWPWTLEQLGPYMKYDPEGAKKLLAEAGFSNGLGRRIELYHPVPSTTNYSSDIAALVADMWKKNLGIDVVETPPPSTTSTSTSSMTM